MTIEEAKAIISVVQYFTEEYGHGDGPVWPLEVRDACDLLDREANRAIRDQKHA